MDVHTFLARLATDDDESAAKAQECLDDLVAIRALASIVRPPAWHTEARCRGVGVQRFTGRLGPRARKLCAVCPVLGECARDLVEGPRPVDGAPVRAGLCVDAQMDTWQQARVLGVEIVVSSVVASVRRGRVRR